MKETNGARITRLLNEAFKERCNQEFKKKFDVELETHWSFLEGTYVSNRVDGVGMTPEQYYWLSGFSDGYSDAMNQALTL